MGTSTTRTLRGPSYIKPFMGTSWDACARHDRTKAARSSSGTRIQRKQRTSSGSHIARIFVSQALGIRNSGWALSVLGCRARLAQREVLMSDATRILPPQTQDRQPGREGKMHPAPDYMPRFPEYAIARTGREQVTSGLRCNQDFISRRSSAGIKMSVVVTPSGLSTGIFLPSFLLPSS
jgi:hypothetical protein